MEEIMDAILFCREERAQQWTCQVTKSIDEANGLLPTRLPDQRTTLVPVKFGQLLPMFVLQWRAEAALTPRVAIKY